MRSHSNLLIAWSRWRFGWLWSMLVGAQAHQLGVAPKPLTPICKTYTEVNSVMSVFSTRFTWPLSSRALGETVRGHSSFLTIHSTQLLVFLVLLYFYKRTKVCYSTSPKSISGYHIFIHKKSVTMILINMCTWIYITTNIPKFQQG